MIETKNSCAIKSSPRAFPVALPEAVAPGSLEALPDPHLRRLASTSENRAAPGAGGLRRGALGAWEKPVSRGRRRVVLGVLEGGLPRCRRKIPFKIPIRLRKN
jgi:hypothetical protein